MKRERRKSFRLKDTLTIVRCSPEYLFESNSLTQDISQNGICIFTKQKMEIGETVNLGIYVPEEKAPIAAKAQVLRRNETDNPEFPYLIALEFSKINEDARQRILKHIRFFLLKN
ncbi:MAG: PilZ domain-containing protein [Candidatus Omnitrophica bacterium]|nr:PilZ domain-containing protein [Candidatus Omnitrophota bacterium]MCF7887345.1 PilZ domain-containing protein [Candidatus Omnitrophota bacterium]